MMNHTLQTLTLSCEEVNQPNNHRTLVVTNMDAENTDKEGSTYYKINSIGPALHRGKTGIFFKNRICTTDN